MYVCVCVCARTYVCVCVCVCIHTCVRACMCACVHAHLCVCAHVYESICTCCRRTDSVAHVLLVFFSGMTNPSWETWCSLTQHPKSKQVCTMSSKLPSFFWHVCVFLLFVSMKAVSQGTCNEIWVSVWFFRLKLGYRWDCLVLGIWTVSKTVLRVYFFALSHSETSKLWRRRRKNKLQSEGRYSGTIKSTSSS